MVQQMSVAGERSLGSRNVLGMPPGGVLATRPVASIATEVVLVSLVGMREFFLAECERCNGESTAAPS